MYTSSNIEDPIEYTSVLKIGYTADDNCSGRLNDYRAFFGKFRTYATIKGGTLEDESALHDYFKPYRAFGREWYNVSDEILNFFKINDTIEKVRDALPYKAPKRLKPEELMLEEQFNLIFHLIEEEGIDSCSFDWKEKAYKQRIKEIDELFTYLSSSAHYPSDKLDLVREKYESIFPKLKDPLLWFNKISSFEGRLRFICELLGGGILSLEDDEYLSYSLPSPYSDYIVQLGEERCASFSYRNNSLEEELDRVLNNQEIVHDLRSAILSLFKVGNRYKRAIIKQSLKELYAKYGYKVTAKASDLGDYFNLRTCSIIDPKTKKKDNGFIIVDIK